MSETYLVIKPFKGNGVQYQAGDDYEMVGAPMEHKLIGKYIKPKKSDEYQRRIEASKQAMYRRRQKAINPEKYADLEEPETEGFLCDECGFEAKSAAGLKSHARKHQEG